MLARLALLTSLSLAPAARAELRFKTNDLQLKATSQDRELKAVFPFSNSGTTPVWIVGVTTSCGCTVATADKPRYEPGDAGQITAIYTIGLSEGRHAHTITVQTDSQKSPSHLLSLTADLPSGQKQVTRTLPPISPQELTWTRPPYLSKIVTVDLREYPTAKLVAASDHPQFELKIDTTSRPGMATVEVTPTASSESARSELSLSFQFPNQPPLEKKIPLIVLARRSTR